MAYTCATLPFYFIYWLLISGNSESALGVLLCVLIFLHRMFSIE